MDFGDFYRLGLVPNLPPRAELPSALRLALAQTFLLPVELVAWVATADVDALRTQMSQAAMVYRESQDDQQADQAGQLVRLILKRLDQLGQAPVPVVGRGKQLHLGLEG
jgi:hypothetical protein